MVTSMTVLLILAVILLIAYKPTNKDNIKGNIKSKQSTKKKAAEPTFFDDFDNLSNWIIHVVPDSHNNEYQYYTDRPENVRVEDGYLKDGIFCSQIRW